MESLTSTLEHRIEKKKPKFISIAATRNRYQFRFCLLSQ